MRKAEEYLGSYCNDKLEIILKQAQIDALAKESHQKQSNIPEPRIGTFEELKNFQKVTGGMNDAELQQLIDGEKHSNPMLASMTP